MLNRLEDAFGRLRRFTGDVSHELRTPIAVVRGEAEFALRKERSNEEYKASLKTIVTEATLMTQIVEDLMLLARANSRSVALRKAEIDVDRFAEELVNSVRAIYDPKGVRVAVIAARGTVGWGSENYLSLALRNVLLNAAKHSATGSEVKLEISEDQDATIMRVRDQGEGIPEDAIPYIFDPFFRADTARNRDSGGAGIGLPLAKALVELHGGTLTVESTLGKGSTFTARIPRRPLQETDTPRVNSPAVSARIPVTLPVVMPNA